MSIGFWQIAVVVILVVLLFGRGKISSLMGDVAKGINIEPGNTGHYMLNPELHGGGVKKIPKFSDGYIPYLVIRYTGEMNIGWNDGADMFIGARFLINPKSQSKEGTDI